MGRATPHRVCCGHDGTSGSGVVDGWRRAPGGRASAYDASGLTFASRADSPEERADRGAAAARAVVSTGSTDGSVGGVEALGDDRVHDAGQPLLAKGGRPV